MRRSEPVAAITLVVENVGGYSDLHLSLQRYTGFVGGYNFSPVESTVSTALRRAIRSYRYL